MSESKQLKQPDIDKKKDVSATVPYQGMVVAKILRKGKVVRTVKKHNRGQSYLFEQIAKMLAGADTSMNMPNYLDAGHSISTDDPNTFSSALIQKTSLTGNYVKKFDNTYWATVFTALIPYSIVRSGTPIDSFALYPTYSAKSPQMLAMVKLPANDEIILNPGESVLIEWRMIISNIDFSTDDTNIGGN